MLWTQRLWLQLQTLFRRNNADEELANEIQFHLDQQIARVGRLVDLLKFG